MYFFQHPWLKAAFRGKYLRDHKHSRWILQDGQSIHAARIYPKKFKQLVAREIRATISDHRQSLTINRCHLNHFEVTPHKLVYNRVPNLTSHTHPNDDSADEDGNMSVHQTDSDDPNDGEAFEQDDKAAGEEVRRNDEAASRPTRRVITVVTRRLQSIKNTW